MYEQYEDSLSRRTWSLALLACANSDIVERCLKPVDATLSTLNEDDFHAVASSSSRLSLNQFRRRLGPDIWGSINGVGDRTALLVTHFAVDLAKPDQLVALSDERLEQLASPMAAAWPIKEAINFENVCLPQCHTAPRPCQDWSRHPNG
jgi:hypothetical protein